MSSQINSFGGNKGALHAARHTGRWVAVISVVTFIVLMGAARVAEGLLLNMAHQSQRNEVLTETSEIRADIEVEVEKVIALIEGMAAVVANSPTLSPDQFDRIASVVHEKSGVLVTTVLAPNQIVSLSYPSRTDASSPSFDFNAYYATSPKIASARETGRAQVEGPIDLPSGPASLVATYPIFADNGEFWGLVSAVIHLDDLLMSVGLIDQDKLDVLLINEAGNGDVVLGLTSVQDRRPVKQNIEFSHGQWRLMATPADGWETEPSYLGWFRLAEFVVILAVMVPLLFMGRLLKDRTVNRIEMQRLVRRLELALSASRIGVWEYDIETEELFWDEHMRRIYGKKPSGPVEYNDWISAVHPDDVELAEAEFNRTIRHNVPYRSGFRVVANGESRYIRTIGNLVADDFGNQRMIGVNWDATEDVKRTEELQVANQLAEARNEELLQVNSRIERLALHDSLTDLPNRRYLDEHLASLKGEVRERVALVHVDLDRFKQVNDTLGHAAGDEVLRKVAKILRNCTRKTDFVARIGGDEFVILSQSESSVQDVEEIAARVQEELSRPLTIDGRPLRMSASMGIAMPGEVQKDPRQLLINADVALYRAKRGGRDTFEVFTEQMHQDVVMTKKLADELIIAIENDEFEPFFQPQVCSKSRQVLGMEALARWHHPTRGVVTPDQFLSVADELNILGKIDNIILKKSLDTLKTFQAANLPINRVSVNVSSRRLEDESLISSLHELEFEPGELIFELVESTFLDNFDEQVALNIDSIREMGIGIEIDDFGSGYASIVSLMNLRPSCLKIDRQLVATVDPRNGRDQLVRSIAEMAAALHIDVLAEGVEREEQATILEEMGCQAMQGYLFGKPMPASVFRTFLMEYSAEQHRNTA